MRSLYFRVWLTVVGALALFALASGWFVQRHVEQERLRWDAVASERLAAWGDLIQRSLPPPDAPVAEQAAAVQEWSQRLRMPLALDNEQGERIGAAGAFERRAEDARFAARAVAIRLDDGRTLWVMRRGPRADGAGAARGPGGAGRAAAFSALTPPGWPPGTGFVLVLVLVFLAVALGAFPVVRRLTRRLEALKGGVEQFGAGHLGQRVDASGRDEVAAVAASFNRAAERVQALVQSHQSLLANASHELRSPLARLKMAVAMLGEAPEGAPRDRLKQEIHTNIAELDALVEEVLLASRLDAQTGDTQTGRREGHETVDLLALAAEEAARVNADVAHGPQDPGHNTDHDAASVDGEAAPVQGDERLLRRALRNLLENARRYGGGEIEVTVLRRGGAVELRVCDRGPGVPESMRERIFEPFFRLPGHAEREGGVGLGLSLVRQIAQRHGAQVRCEAREGGGSCFVIVFPA